MIKAIGFKQLSVIDYNQCLVRLIHFSLIHGARASYMPFFRARARAVLGQIWCQTNMSAPDSKPRRGLFAATGDYLWFGFSDGLDSFSDSHPVLDLRRKVRPVARPVIPYFRKNHGASVLSFLIQSRSNLGASGVPGHSGKQPGV